MILSRVCNFKIDPNARINLASQYMVDKFDLNATVVSKISDYFDKFTCVVSQMDDYHIILDNLGHQREVLSIILAKMVSEDCSKTFAYQWTLKG